MADPAAILVEATGGWTPYAIGYLIGQFLAASASRPSDDGAGQEETASGRLSNSTSTVCLSVNVEIAMNFGEPVGQLNAYTGAVRNSKRYSPERLLGHARRLVEHLVKN